MISKNLAQLLGGDILVSSREGVGTVMTVVMPLRLPSAHASVSFEKGHRPVSPSTLLRPMRRRRPSEAGSGRQRSSSERDSPRTPSSSASVDEGCQETRLLIAEDTASSRKLLESMVRRLGGRALLSQTKFVANGAEALEAFRSSASSVKLVVLDMHMPVMDGLEALRAIRQLQKDAPVPCPIVALSADAFSDQRERALEAGFTDYLTKPISLSRLQTLLSQFFEVSAP